jgi:hypothetical protein
VADTQEVQKMAIDYERVEEMRHRRFRVVELYVWMLIAAVCLSGVLVERLVYGAPWEIVIRRRYGDLLLGFFVMMFPILFQLVFGQFPLETLRRKKQEQADLKKFMRGPPAADTDVDEAEKPIPAPSIRIESPSVEASISIGRQSLAATREDFIKSLSAERLLLDLADSSKKLADGIYGRSGVYLLVGVMVAFSGLAFFYTQTSGSFDTKDITGLMVSLAPKFGILFFIEFVAFFFLKQYRTSMDEFRYYEAIKRRREEMLALIKMGNEQSKPVDPFELVKLGHFFSVAGRLEKEETTELLEARKLEKNETAVLEKAIDAIAQARK